MHGLSGAAGEDRHVLRQSQLTRDHSLGIVVALDNENSNIRPVQANHLLTKKQTGMEVLPVAIVDVASEEDEIDVLGQCFVYHPLKRAARRGAQALHGCAVVAV